MKKTTFIFLTIIILFASILRLWELGKVPISPDWDEVALGYNAYSILQTGRDEYGKFLPIVLRSFDDYKPALYAYFAIPSIVLFGFNTFAVRFPSAFFGVLAVIATYFLLKELFPKAKQFSIFNFQFSIGEVASFLLAISPWHLQFSRIAFESNVGVAFNIFSVLFFLKGLKKPLFLILSAILMGINIYIYQSEKVFTPLILFALVLIYRKEVFKIPKKYLVTAVLIGFAIVVPMLIYTFTNQDALQRARGVSVFSQSSLLEENSKKLLVDKNNRDYLGLILDNRRIVFAKAVISGYLSHFDLNWLFITGDIARHHPPNMGLMYLFELPFLFLGVYYLFFDPSAGGFDKRAKLLIFAWFLIAPIPASITSGVPHAVRTLNFLPTFQIFTAIGIISAIQFVSSIKYQVLSIKAKYLIFTLCILFFIFNFLYYLNQYFVQQNYFNAKEWLYGYEKIIPEVKKLEENYDKIIVSNQPPMDQSYMFFLFYLRYPPDLYQKESQGAAGGFRENHYFGKYEFRLIDWIKDSKKQNTLFVGRPTDFTENVKELKRVSYPDGSSAMLIVGN